MEFLQKRADDKKREELEEAQRMDERMRELLDQEQQLLESLHSHKAEQHQARCPANSATGPSRRDRGLV